MVNNPTSVLALNVGDGFISSIFTVKNHIALVKYYT